MIHDPALSVHELLHLSQIAIRAAERRGRRNWWRGFVVGVVSAFVGMVIGVALAWWL